MTPYSFLSKLNYKSKQYEVFHPLRVVGLACELGHKSVHSQGVLSLTTSDVKQVYVSGKLKLQDEGRTRALSSYTLPLRNQDAELARDVVLKHVLHV